MKKIIFSLFFCIYLASPLQANSSDSNLNESDFSKNIDAMPESEKSVILSLDPVDGPYGGDILAVAADPFVPNTMLASAWGKGLFRTVNGGVNWEPLSLVADSGYVPFILYDPTRSGVIYAVANQIYKSTDNGATWLNVWPYAEEPLSMAMDPFNPNILYASSSQGLFKSLDGGITWNKISNNPQDNSITTLVIDPQMPTTLYAIATYWSSSIYKSIDGGITWTAIGSGITDPYIYDIAVDPNTPNVLYAGGQNSSYLSLDAGKSWRAMSTIRSANAIEIDPRTSTVYAAGLHGIYKSTDKGMTWQAYNTGLLDVRMRSIALDPHASSTLYAGTTGSGIYKSVNAANNWLIMTEGITGVKVTSVLTHPSMLDVIYVATLTAGVFKSEDGGKTWRSINQGLSSTDIYCMVIDPKTPSTLYLGTTSSYGDVVYKSEDAGNTWRPTGAIPNSASIATIIIDPKTSSTLYAANYNGVYKSTNGGNTWALSGLSMESIGVLAIDPVNNNVIYAGSSYQKGVFKSTDAGSSWTPINSGLKQLTVRSLIVDPNSPNTLYVSTPAESIYSGLIFKSINAGANWMLSLELLEQQAAAMGLDSSTKPSTLYASTYSSSGDTAVYKSYSGLDQWTLFAPPINSGYAYALHVDIKTPKTLYLGGNYGLYRALVL